MKFDGTAGNRIQLKQPLPKKNTIAKGVTSSGDKSKDPLDCGKKNCYCHVEARPPLQIDPGYECTIILLTSDVLPDMSALLFSVPVRVYFPFSG